jgi:hypothetical protein
MRRILIRCLAAFGLSCAALAHSADVPSTQVEIYRIAPGQHVAFLKLIALYDQANVEAGCRRANFMSTRTASTGII